MKTWEKEYKMRKLAIFVTTSITFLMTGCGNGDGPAGGSGLIETNETLVAAEASGRVLERRVDEGAEVLTGDTLLLIDPSRMDLELASATAGLTVLESQLPTARATVELAQRTEQYALSEFARVEKLSKSGTATERQYDEVAYNKDQAVIGRKTAESRLLSLKAEIARAGDDIARLKRQRADFCLLAPVAGTVIEKYIEQGELASPGKPVVRISELDTVWAKVYLTAPRFAEVKLGDPARIDTEAGDNQYRGTVVWTSEEAEFTPKNIQTEQARADLVYAVKVSIPNPDRKLKSGMPVFITLEK